MAPLPGASLLRPAWLVGPGLGMSNELVCTVVARAGWGKNSDFGYFKVRHPLTFCKVRVSFSKSGTGLCWAGTS